MSEAKTKNPNQRTRDPRKIVGYSGAVILASLGIGAGFNYASEHVNPFVNNKRIPTQNQPHLTYDVKPGDTEGSVAAQFGHTGDLAYENMINDQLPKNDQPSRTLQAGEQLKLPTEG